MKTYKDISPTLKRLETDKRNALLELLKQCNEGAQLTFKRMYSHLDLELPIQEVVQNMPTEKLDWAIFQCENTLKENAHRK